MKNLTKRETTEQVQTVVEFMFSEEAKKEMRLDFSGFTFPCKSGGTTVDLDSLSDEGRKNYEECMKHPERFSVWNELQVNRWPYVKPAEGDCACGRHIVLDIGHGEAYTCECGRCYDIYGSELLPVENWESEPPRFMSQMEVD